jgi:transcription elongation factor Elf1
MTRSQEKSLLEFYMFQHTMSCSNCGLNIPSTPGRSNENARYICRKCGKTLRVKIEQIRTEEAARLIVRNLSNPNFVEGCPTCGRCRNHLVVHSEADDAYFLHCASCGDELREVDEKEIA